MEGHFPTLRGNLHPVNYLTYPFYNSTWALPVTVQLRAMPFLSLGCENPNQLPRLEMSPPIFQVIVSLLSQARLLQLVSGKSMSTVQAVLKFAGILWSWQPGWNVRWLPISQLCWSPHFSFQHPQCGGTVGLSSALLNGRTSGQEVDTSPSHAGGQQ